MSKEKFYVLFTLMGTTYAISSEKIEQMEMVGPITPVPSAPLPVKGIVFLRGRVVPVVDLRLRFGFPPVNYDLKTRLIVIKHKQGPVGLIVDGSREFVAIPDEAIQPTPEGITDLSGKYLTGLARIGERPVLIMNTDELLNMEEIKKLAPLGDKLREEERDEG